MNPDHIIAIIAFSPFAYYLLKSIRENNHFRNEIRHKSKPTNGTYTPPNHVTDRLKNIENMNKSAEIREADKYNDTIDEIGK